MPPDSADDHAAALEVVGDDAADIAGDALGLDLEVDDQHVLGKRHLSLPPS